MKFYAALNVEGTHTYQVLTYFMAPIHVASLLVSEVSSLFRSKRYRVLQLNEDDWPIGIVLVEAIFATPEQAVLAIAESSLLGSAVDSIVGSMCMFDGAFGGHAEVFSREYADQIYSVWVKGDGLNLGMNGDLRASDGWWRLILYFKEKLGL